ncbi:YeeE/YedE family protein [Henriciella sp.]|uniref:YeeE/YedE family protein n=1 Tax=Henriciella sp. TaxID=1968823 RepID=UPI002625CD3A|nr:YeeE/YedE family protein [Henriciella sp.]
MENFTPLSASIGGALIGVSAVLLMALHGRIAGISGLFSGMVFADRGDRTWRVFFVAGLVLAAPAWLAASGQGIAFDLDAGWPLIVAGGLLVGFGTRLGSGCTSGHGVCGLSRLSSRSMVSVALFMGAGMATVALVKPLFGG